MTVRIFCALLALCLLWPAGCSESGVKGSSTQDDVGGPGLDGDDDTFDDDAAAIDAVEDDAAIDPDGAASDAAGPDGDGPDGDGPDADGPDADGPDGDGFVAPGTCITDACDVGNCASIAACASVLDCIEACENTSCAEGCMDGAPGAVAESLGGVVVCAVFAGCLMEGGDPPGGNCCVGHDEAGCGDDACAEAVCALDDYCCEVEWDDICAGVAVESCDACEGPGPVCGDDTCDDGESCVTCPGDCGECTDSDCCEPHDDAGCSDAACQADVCADDQFCCNASWDEACVELAFEICESCEGGGPECGDGVCDDFEGCDACPTDCGPCDEGDCCQPHDGVGCDDGGCQEQVCDNDPFCCEAEWDDVCADQANESCDVCGGGGPICGDGDCEDGEECPEDCGGGGVLECLAAECDADDCYDSDVCAEALFCIFGCESQECAIACIQGAPGAVQGQVIGILECGSDSGCFEGTGPECGDGECNGDESCGGCAEDCGPCGGGGCCEGNDGVGCEDPDCEAAVCAEDSYCCDVNWDGICADLASEICGGCGGGGPVCGDGVCEDGEACLEDCEQVAVGCLVDNCNAQQCLNNPNCFAGLQCLSGCDEEECAIECIDGLPGPVQQTLIGLIECGSDAGCFEGGEDPVCGDGVCEEGEVCLEDCEQQVVGCLVDNCDAESCLNNTTCFGGLECLSGCEDEDCAVGCIQGLPGAVQQVLIGLIECGSDAGCFEDGGPDCGNGDCEDGESCDSCPNDCGPCAGGTCCEAHDGVGCDDPACADEICANDPFCCNNQWDGICADAAQSSCAVCDGGGPFCGDGICQPDELCPQDCNDPGSCVTDSCETGNCSSFPFCAEILDCVSGCNTEECANDCLDGVPDTIAQLLVGVIECASDAGCFEPTGPTCGDGQCGPFESCGSCPIDCGPCEGGDCCEPHDGVGCDDAACADTVCAVDPFCCDNSWDGLCAGEAQDMCEVCGATGPVCGDGVCEPGEVCDVDCADPGGCLADSCDFGNCPDFDACADALSCLEDCATEGCAEGCLEGLGPNATEFLTGVIACGVDAGCFAPEPPGCGDGECSSVESCQSCPDDCGECPVGDCCEGNDAPGCSDAACQDAVCALDPFCCESAWDGICADLATNECEVCGATGPVCGDGECEPGEVCDIDCGDPGGCLSNNCDYGNCQNFEACAAALACMEECGTQECAEDCIQGVGNNGAQFLAGIVGCGVEAGCFEPAGPTCGDGVCEPGEVCDADCAVPEGCLLDSCDVGACPDFPECAATLDCMIDCATASCADSCLADAGPEIGQFLGGVLTCGIESGCYGPVIGPQCGDGQCDAVIGEACDTCPADCGACGAGGCCEDNGSPGCNDAACEDVICAADPFCCENQWDSICSNAAQEECEVCGAVTPGCGDEVCAGDETCGTCPQDCGGCAGDCCSANGSAGCGSSDCMVTVCEIAPHCCLDDWDSECAALAAGICEVCEAGPECGNGQCEAGETQDNCPVDCGGMGNPFCGDGECNANETCAQCEQDCGGCAGECCEANSSPGCEDTVCQQFVCNENLECCYSGWDGTCAELAAELCDACGGGPECGNGVCEAGENGESCPNDCDAVPSCGDGACSGEESCSSCAADCGACEGGCCEDNGGGNPGCNDPECQDAVCDADPFCCQVTWDIICASAAEETCDGCSASSCGDGVCDEGEDCPADCSQSTAECLSDSCGFANCQNFNGCNTALECIVECDDSECAEACIPPNLPAANFLLNLVGCGEESGCFEAGPDGPSCGDGECNGDEDCVSCAADCGGCEGDCCGPNESIGCDDASCQAAVCEQDPFCCDAVWDEGCADQASECEACPDSIFDNPLLQCVDDACGLDECVTSSGCLAALECVVECDGFECLLGCLQEAPAQDQGTLLNLYQCGQAAGCL